MRWQAGYTVVEVTLFLGLSGLLILAVIGSFNSSIRSTRYTDTNRSFEAVIKEAYSTVRAGEVTRQVDANGRARCGLDNKYPGASDVCQVLGKVLRISTGVTSRVTTFNVIAQTTPTLPCPGTGIDKIKCYAPTVLYLQEPASVYYPEWGTRIPAGGGSVVINNAGTSPISMSYLAILRDPESELVYMSAFTGNTSIGAGAFPLAVAGRLDASYTNTKAQILLCHEGNRPSFLQFSGGESAGSIAMSSEPLITGMTGVKTTCP